MTIGSNRHSTFQSTSPVRGTTSAKGANDHRLYISIHVPREGDDCFSRCWCWRSCYFNPRPP